MFDDMLQRAIELHRAGALEDAGRLYDALLQLDPRHADAWNLRGVLYCQSGDLERAEQFVQQAIRILPGQPSFYSNLGEIYRRRGRQDQALDCFLQALALDPANADAHNNLGIVYQAQGKLREAARSYERALQFNPQGAEGYNNLGTLYEKMGEYEAAVRVLRRAIELRPDYTAAWNNLGAAYIVQSQLDEARTCLMRSLELQPDHAEAWNNLGTTYQVDGEFTAALPLFKRALGLSPAYSDALRNVANCYRSLGDMPASSAAFDHALRVQGDDGLRMRAAVGLPPIPTSLDEIDRTRSELDAALSELEQRTLRVADPVQDIGLNHFYLAYQGLDDRELNVRLAALCRRACPELQYVAPHCRRPVGLAGNRPIRIGFVSAYFQQHSVGRLMAGLIAQLSRQRFHVSLVRLPGIVDSWAQHIDTLADAVLVTNKLLPRAIEQIAQQEFDILVYADIGMEPLSYYLAFARLAPVQCASWGHPVTSGIPEIDYFISARDLEPADGESHYSERLVRLSAPPTYFYPIPPSASRRERADITGLALAADAHWYFCAQSLFKIHPEFDGLLKRILSEDPRGHLVLISAKERAWRETLQARFQRTMPDACRRVHFIPQLPTGELVRMFELADVVLDTIHFSGGLTTLEALSVGQPVVTLPGRFMRGRVTAAYYQQIGITEVIARNADDYVRLALRLADDAGWRDELRREIRTAHVKLYENLAVVRELEQFLLVALERASNKLA